MFDKRNGIFSKEVSEKYKQPDGTYKVGSYTIKQLECNRSWELSGPGIEKCYTWLDDAIGKAVWIS